MSYIKSPEVKSGCRKISKVGELSSLGINYLQAIENADGVPFQLIFGPIIGEGYYLSMGSGINQLLGIKPEDFTEKLYYSLVKEINPLNDNISSNITETREKFIGGEIKSYKAEVLVKLPSGEMKWLVDSSLPLYDPETANVIGSYGILFDITERKQTNLILENARIKAEEGDRLKSAFLHNISHEIRTPLNAIVGFSSLLTESTSGNDEKHELADIILRSSDHLLEILNDIVEISNIEVGNVFILKEKVNVNEKLRSLYKRFNIRAEEKDIKLDFKTPQNDDEVNIISDSVKLQQILGYLIANAIKFTKKGRIEYGYRMDENEIEFYVRDTGIGIHPEYHNLIFDRFFQSESSTTRRYEGTGLGLSISKALIELMGGKIWFNSLPDEGSVFYFTIPLERNEE